ncbi:MAG: chemotaxis protein CheA [Bdellovibrionales bacterium]|nr:chemotaxis protein CheA [Bdellovibrionales bacterium]
MPTESDDKAFFEELKREFLSEASFLLEQCDESCLKLDDEGLRQEALDEIFRVFHSVKGGAAAVGFEDLSRFAHSVENCLGILRKSPDLISPNVTTILFQSNDALKARIEALKNNPESRWDIADLSEDVRRTTEGLESQLQGGAPVPLEPRLGKVSRNSDDQGKTQKNTVRVDTKYIDTVLDLIGELVVIKSQLLHSNFLVQDSSRLKLDGLLSLFDKTVRDLQDRALRMRMTPLKSAFMKAQRQVRELSQKLEKPANIEITGEATEIDRDLIEQLSDPLVHLIRNAMDHGIEGKDERQQAGKPEQATIKLSAQQARGRIVIEIVDDGRGISREKVLASAEKKGLLPPGTDLKNMSDGEVFGLLFKPGFSTAEKVSDLSGRGVGLDVVKSNLEKIKGTIEIESTVGKGTTFRFSIPLTAAIFDGMVVMVGQSHFILPLDKIDEISQLRKMKLYSAGERKVVDFRGEMIDVVCMQEAFGLLGRAEPAPSESDVIVVLHFMDYRYAVRLQSIIGQAQVVVKSLGEQFQKIPDISGAAVLGDGKIALIVDSDGVARRMGVSNSGFGSLARNSETRVANL